MTDFNVGDRVVYRAASPIFSGEMEGEVGTITRTFDDSVSVKWDNPAIENTGYLMKNLTLLNDSKTEPEPTEEKFAVVWEKKLKDFINSQRGPYSEIGFITALVLDWEESRSRIVGD